MHYAAYKNIERACEILINFFLNEKEDQIPKVNEEGEEPQLTNGGSGETGEEEAEKLAQKEVELTKRKERDLKRRQLTKWINLNSAGEDGFTGLHFASFHGNMVLIKLLIKHGANIFSKNRQGLNLLHVAAQGDQPVSLAFFLQRGLTINSVDIRDSTPLHWAAFSGSELTLSYIIAWGGNLNAIDTKGLTPLHLAVKSYKDSRSTKGIKQLLLKGADRNAMDFQGMKPIDYVPLPERIDTTRNTSQVFLEKMTIEIRKLLQEEWSLLGDCLMIKKTFKKQEKTPFTLVMYFVLMSATFAVFELTSFKIVKFSARYDWLIYTCYSLFALSMFLCTTVWLKDPGFIHKDKSIDFVEMLD